MSLALGASIRRFDSYITDQFQRPLELNERLTNAMEETSERLVTGTNLRAASLAVEQSAFNR